MQFDDIGAWSEIKLDILKKYAAAYSTTLANQPGLHHVYIDAFAGSGVHVARSTGDFVPGSPLNALLVQPPFKEYFLIDLAPDKIASLREIVGPRTDVHLLSGDCNVLLLEELLDPYGLDLDWQVMATAGNMRSVDMFLNFRVMDMNRNVFWRDPGGVDPADAARMTRFWGDDSWRSVMYSTAGNLFGYEEKSGDNDTIAHAFQKRLEDVAHFKHVPEPLPMRNSRGNVVYYLFFASQNRTGDKIVREIFAKYR